LAQRLRLNHAAHAHSFVGADKQALTYLNKLARTTTNTELSSFTIALKPAACTFNPKAAFVIRKSALWSIFQKNSTSMKKI
jgi:hypothetical protein